MDKIETVLAAENHHNQRSHFTALADARDTSRRAYDQAAKEKSERVRPAVLAARKAFHNAAVPRVLRRHVAISWAESHPAVNWDWTSDKHGTVSLYLEFTVSVAGASFSGKFHARCVEDATAAGWKAWGVIEWMLRGYDHHCPAEKIPCRSIWTPVPRTLPPAIEIPLCAATKVEDDRESIRVGIRSTMRELLSRAVEIARDDTPPSRDKTTQEIVSMILGTTPTVATGR